MGLLFAGGLPALAAHPPRQLRRAAAGGGGRCHGCRARGGMQTTIEQQVIEFSLHVAGLVRPLNVRIAKHDRDLGRQLRKSCSAFVLNLSEGFGSTGGHKRERFGKAHGSTKEARDTLRFAIVYGYLDARSPVEALEALDRLGGRILRVVAQLTPSFPARHSKACREAPPPIALPESPPLPHSEPARRHPSPSPPLFPESVAAAIPRVRHPCRLRRRSPSPSPRPTPPPIPESVAAADPRVRPRCRVRRRSPSPSPPPSPPRRGVRARQS
jgi:four helix bundle protein